MYSIHPFKLAVCFLLVILGGCTSLPSEKTVEIEPPVEPVLEPLLEPIQEKPQNLWVEISSGYGLPAVPQQKIEKNLRWLSKHQSYMDKVTKQSEPFLYYVTEQFRNNDIPLELTLIPIVESAFNPNAQSRSKALGLWQFLARTGRHFGLEQNLLYDERRDVIASTDAAVRYLQYLHKYFEGDWLLAIAAYNAGEGRVQRAIKQNKKLGKPTDFWSLPLPKQTQHYVPQILALSKVVANPQAYNLTIEPIENRPYFTKINNSKTIDMVHAAKMANINPDIMRKLNAGHTKSIIAPSAPKDLLIPVDHQDQFSNILPSLPIASIPANELRALSSATTYVVKSGDNLWLIAKKHKTKVKTLQQLNKLSEKSLLRPGQKLKISAP